MAFERPSLSDLFSQAETDLAGRLGLGSLLRRGMLRALARMTAGLAHLLHGHLAWATRQLFPDSADDESLDRWAETFGLARLAATRSSGLVRFTGSDGSTVPSGSRMRRADAAEFETLEDATVSGGTVDVEVQAVEPGSDGDTLPGAGALTLSPAVSGVALSVEVLAPGIEDGTDRESDDDLRARLLALIRSGRRGGSSADYESWALEYPVASRVWVLPLHNGPGTVGVTFLVSSGSTAPIPDAGQVAALQDVLDARRPVTASVLVFAPGTQEIDVELELEPDTLAVRASVSAALDELFDREAEPGGTIPLSHVREAVSTAAGEFDHVLVAPVADITVPAGTLAVLGTVTFS